VKTFFKPLKPVSLFTFLSLITGILSGSYFSDHPVSHFLILLFLCGLFFFCLKIKKYIIYLIIGIAFCFGFISIQLTLNPDLPSNHVSNYLDFEKRMITGEIVTFAKHYKKKQTVTLVCQTIESKDGITKEVTGKINLNVYRSPGNILLYGDIVRFKSAIKSPRNFNNPGAFDYEKFLKLKGVYGTAYTDAKKIIVLSQKESIGWIKRFIRNIESIRNRYYSFILKSTNGSETGKITASLITGKKEGLSAELRDMFSRAGISHLFAISGLHLSIVCFFFFTLFYQILSFFPKLSITGNSKKFAGAITLIPLTCYAVFSGFSPSTQRALLMIAIVLMSYAFEREKDIFSSLSIAGILILVMDSSALFSISFQLSFMAVIFIIFGVSFFKKVPFEYKRTLLGKIGLMICVTFFANLGTLPLTAHYFNLISFIALISNLIFIPLIGFAVLPLGLVALAGFSVLPIVSGGIIQICSHIISVCLTVSERLVSIPHSWSRTSSLEWIEATIIYLFLFSVLFAVKGKRKIPLLFLGVAFLLAIVHFSGDRPDKIITPNLSVTVIDVGQGNSALIETSEGRTLLVDGGGFSDVSTFDTGRYIIAPFLWKKGIHALDYVILSHPESDHLNGLIFILKNFKVGELIKNSDERDSMNYRELINTCKENKVRIWDSFIKDKTIDLGETTIEFYDSFPYTYSAGFNNHSLVFKLSFKDFSMLFPGDIHWDREKALGHDTKIDLHADILLSPHHGSTTSSSKFFLEKVQPMSVIISCGWNNRYGFPHDTVLKRYHDMQINVFRTDADGAVFISSDGKAYKIKTRKGG